MEHFLIFMVSIIYCISKHHYSFFITSKMTLSFASLSLATIVLPSSRSFSTISSESPSSRCDWMARRRGRAAASATVPTPNPISVGEEGFLHRMPTMPAGKAETATSATLSASVSKCYHQPAADYRANSSLASTCKEGTGGRRAESQKRAHNWRTAYRAVRTTRQRYEKCGLALTLAFHDFIGEVIL